MISLAHILDEFASKDQPQGLLIEQVAVFAWLEVLAIFCHCATGNEAMQMKMGIKHLVPAVQNGDKSQFASKPIFGIMTECEQGLGHCFEQDIEHDLLIGNNHRVELVGQGKDGMEIGERQKLLFSCLEPSFPGHILACGAVAVSARVIGNPFGATRVALINVAAEISCPAAEQIIDDFVVLRGEGDIFSGNPRYAPGGYGRCRSYGFSYR